MIKLHWQVSILKQDKRSCQSFTVFINRDKKHITIKPKKVAGSPATLNQSTICTQSTIVLLSRYCDSSAARFYRRAPVV